MTETGKWLGLFTPELTIGAAVRNLGTRIQFKDSNQSDPLPRTFNLGILWSMGVKAQDLLGEDTGFPDHFNFLKVNLLADLTAFVDKLKEDDEEGLQRAVEDRLALEENGGKTEEEIRNELEAERGVGIHALRWRNMQKAIGMEFWLVDMLALRLGYRIDPYIPNADIGDRLSMGLGLRLPISSLLLVALHPDSSGNSSNLQRFYGQTDRQMFLELHLTSLPVGGPTVERQWTVQVAGGF